MIRWRWGEPRWRCRTLRDR